MPELECPSGRLPPASPSTPALPVTRRHERQEVEMLARLRRGLVNVTVVLKDLTPMGARILGIGPVEEDEVVALTLPECRPMIAFVAWAGRHDAGLEFVHALPGDLYAELVSRYGLNGASLPRD